MISLEKSQEIEPEAGGVKPFTPEEWQQLPWWLRKKIVFMGWWFLTTGRVKKWLCAAS